MLAGAAAVQHGVEEEREADEEQRDAAEDAADDDAVVFGCAWADV